MITGAFLIAAFVAGLLMFLAPCTLPIVPGYLAFISGVPAGALMSSEGRRRVRSRIVRNAVFFVVGFSVIFILLGVFASAIGSALGAYRFLIAQAGGALLILFGFMLLGIFKVPSFLAERRIRMPRFLTLGHPSSSFLIGAIFALGWSPCVGPILGSILLIAGSEGGALAGALLLGVFSLGLGAPFILTAVLIGEASEAFARAGRFTKVLTVLGGIFLILLGALMLSGNMAALVTYGFQLLDFMGYDRLVDYI